MESRGPAGASRTGLTATPTLPRAVSENGQVEIIDTTKEGSADGRDSRCSNTTAYEPKRPRVSQRDNRRDSQLG